MILLQLSSGKGPEECARAVALAFEQLQKQSRLCDVTIDIMEAVPGDRRQCYKSVLLKLTGDRASELAQQWQGVMQWICESPFRPKHKRKNWFFNGCLYDMSKEQDSVADVADIQFKTCKASGAGGQHVNTTDSAVQATHLTTGIKVKVSTERSQHANKKLARLLIAVKLHELREATKADQQHTLWSQHNQLERGNPVRVFRGEKLL